MAANSINVSQRTMNIRKGSLDTAENVNKTVPRQHTLPVKDKNRIKSQVKATRVNSVSPSNQGSG